jgi:hypothetical protein
VFERKNEFVLRITFSKKNPRLPEPTPLKVIGYVNDDISGDIEIKKLVEKNENDKKIVELFKTQLLLPINLRNKTLMSRFGIDVTKNGLIDAWPSSTNASVKFHVNCYFPTTSQSTKTRDSPARNRGFWDSSRKSPQGTPTTFTSRYRSMG